MINALDNIHHRHSRAFTWLRGGSESKPFPRFIRLASRTRRVPPADAGKLQSTKTNQPHTMNTKVLILALALGASTGLLRAQDGPPPADGQRPPAGEQGPRGPRGWVHVLPPGADQRLNLTDDQKKQIASLEADVASKLQTILTSDQVAQLKQMHPPRPQGEGNRGPGGSNGGPGGFGGPGDEPGGPGGGPGDGPAGGPDGAPAGPGGFGGGRPPGGNQ